jgi:hypothetical protein
MTTQRRAVNFTIVALATAVSAAAIWLEVPHDPKVTSLGVFLAKLVPFVLATESIAWLDPEWLSSRLLKMLIVLATFVTFFVYFVPRLFYYGSQTADFDIYYNDVLTLTPLVILSLVLAFRLGGGDPGTARRMSYAMLLVMLSGVEDLAFRLVNGLGVPARWTWAYHIEVFFGHFPTSTEAYVFLGVHLILATLVLTVPGRWFRREPRRPAAPTGPASVAVVPEPMTERAETILEAAEPGVAA